MMFEASTPQGKVTWLSDLDNPFVGSPVVIVRLTNAAQSGIQVAWPSEPVMIDLMNSGDVRFAMEALYGDEVTFSPNAPEPTQFFEPAEPGFIY